MPHNDHRFRWSRWRPLPDPRTGGGFSAPTSFGIFEVRWPDCMPGEFIAVIASHDLARRLATIYPPWIERPVRGVMQGSGNALSHLLGDALGALKYRTRPAGSAKQADEVAASLSAERKHRFIEWTDGRLIENDQNQLNCRKERTDEKGRDGK